MSYAYIFITVYTCKIFLHIHRHFSLKRTIQNGFFVDLSEFFFTKWPMPDLQYLEKHVK